MNKPVSTLLASLLLALSHTALAAGGGGGSSGPYAAIEPAVVVNLQGSGKPRFMQVKIQAMSKDPAVLEALTTHKAPVRDALIMLLSAQSAETMYDIQAREQVRLQALEALRKVLEEHAGITAGKGEGASKGLEGLYFTDFVIQ